MSKNKRNGYIYVSIHSKTKSLHRLIALTFIPNPENKPFVDHINCIRDDNKLDNLRWVTVSENTRNTLIKNRGCLRAKNDKRTLKDGTVKIYNYYSFEWYYEPMKKKSKRFKTKEQAETFRDTIYPPHK